MAKTLCFLVAVAWPSVAHEIKGWTVPPEAKAVKNPLTASPAVIAAGKALYLDKCANCHGDTGHGDGPEADMYDTAPTNLAEPGMLAEMSDGELFWKITTGRRPMPSFKKPYTDEQRWQLVHFIRTLAPEKPAKSAPTKKSAPKRP